MLAFWSSDVFFFFLGGGSGFRALAFGFRGSMGSKIVPWESYSVLSSSEPQGLRKMLLVFLVNRTFSPEALGCGGFKVQGCAASHSLASEVFRPSSPSGVGSRRGLSDPYTES